MKMIAALRMMLARASVADMFSELARTVINGRYIPQVREMIERAEMAGDSEEVARLNELLGMFEEYADKNNQNSHEYGDAAAGIVSRMSRARGLSNADSEDAVSMILEDMSRPNIRWGTLNPNDGPIGFLKLFKQIVTKQAQGNIQDVQRRKNKLPTLRQRDDSEGDDSIGVVEQLPDERLAKPEMSPEELVNILQAAIRRRFRKEWEIALFDKWAEEFEQGDVSNLRQQVLIPVADEFAVPESTVWNTWRDMRQYLAEVLKKLGAGDFKIASTGNVVARVARSEYLRRLAKWVLSSSMRYDSLLR